MADEKTQNPEIADAEQGKDTPFVLITPARDEHEAPAPEAEVIDEATPEEVAQTSEPEDAVEEPAEPEAARDVLPPPAPPAPTEAPKQGGGFLPLLLGGVAAAAIGVGATLFVLPSLPSSVLESLSLQPKAELDAAGLSAALADQAARSDALAAELAALRAAPAPVADMSGVQAALDQATAAARTASEAQAALEARIVALESGPAADAVPPAALDELRAEVQALRGQMDQRSTGDAAAQEQIAAAVAVAQERILQAEEEAARLRGESEASARRMMVQAAMARVATAIDSGASLVPAVAELEAAGVTAPDALKVTVPTITQLQAGFPQAARDALAVARKEAAGDTLTGRVGAFLMAQVGARSLDAREGDDPDAILSRAQGAVDQGDIATAVAELGSLPPSGQAALGDWLAQAQARVAALEALTALSQSVN
ncbi:hypothetical protein LZA78_12005 [Sinirhodobacter sp. WL0062]|uniref:Mitochondrial inner membrane protein n=1 Tax=Rhodobacter flavimaris TaxID=2907145 RepID=A0ABS8Z0F3_9RHOB|nr:hypothetical protein [Sinirhodobacter sp. WL0062]MCE5974209.1 hypothetical protein [Sinirhodobacter sp. WL0062]